MNKDFVYKTVKPISVFVSMYCIGLIFQLIPSLRLFYGQLSIIDLIVVLLVMIFFSKGNIRIYGFKKTKIKTYFFSIVVTFIFVLLWSVIQLYYLHIYNTNSSVNDQSVILTFLTAVLIAPIAEELMCRGYLQTNLEHLSNKGFFIFKVYLNLPVIISALFFGLFHLGILLKGASFLFVLCLVVYTFFIGLISGYFKSNSGSIYPSIVVHSFANLLSPIFITIFIHCCS